MRTTVGQSCREQTNWTAPRCSKLWEIQARSASERISASQSFACASSLYCAANRRVQLKMRIFSLDKCTRLFDIDSWTAYPIVVLRFYRFGRWAAAERYDISARRETLYQRVECSRRFVGNKRGGFIRCRRGGEKLAHCAVKQACAFGGSGRQRQAGSGRQAAAARD